MIPKDKKLFCKTCEKSFDLDTKKEEDYKIIKKVRHTEKESAPLVVKEGLETEKISSKDRKAFEEYFETTEEDGY